MIKTHEKELKSKKLLHTRKRMYYNVTVSKRWDIITFFFNG